MPRHPSLSSWGNAEAGTPHISLVLLTGVDRLAIDAVAFSCDIALPATAPESFSVAVEAMGATMRETVYVSANPGHVAAAEAAGLQGLLYDGPESLRRLLRGG